jgi:hypothetical protein
VPVYFATLTPAGPRLAREFLRVEGTGNVVADAVDRMFEPPLDPNYATPWVGELLDAEQRERRIVLDLSAEAAGLQVGRAEGALMVQQAVFTATAAAGRDVPVRFLVEGRRPGTILGGTDVATDVRRADPLEVRQLVQLNTPNEGEVVTGGKLTVTGEAATFEGTVPWRVVRQRDAVEIRAGFTTTSEAGRLAPFSFRVSLPRGIYTVEVREEDAASGEGLPPTRDTRTVVIR